MYPTSSVRTTSGTSGSTVSACPCAFSTVYPCAFPRATMGMPLGSAPSGMNSSCWSTLGATNACPYVTRSDPSEPPSPYTSPTFGENCSP